MGTWAVLTLFCGLTISLHLFGQSPPSTEPIFHMDVRVVQVDAQVLSKKTRHAVTALKKDDYEIYEDNVRQQVSSFSQDTLPLSVVLLFDLTDSVRPNSRTTDSGSVS